MTTEIHILIRKSKETAFMQAAGVFESFKVLHGGLWSIELNRDDGISSLCNRLVQVETDKPIAIWCDGFAWKDDTVKAISDGRSWCMLDDFLVSKGFPSEALVVRNHNQVTSIPSQNDD